MMRQLHKVMQAVAQMPASLDSDEAEHPVKNKTTKDWRLEYEYDSNIKANQRKLHKQ